METRPVVPVYLNQRLVFDSLAILDNGIATITSVTDRATSSESDARQYGTTFGLGQALSSLFQIGMSGERTKGGSSSTERTAAEERIHTPTSLFFKLRGMLTEKNLITSLADGTPLEAGALIEFQSQLRRNPLQVALDSFLSFGELFLSFQTSGQPHKGKGGRGAQPPDGVLGMKQVLEQIQAVRDSVVQGSTTDLVSDALTGENGRAVLTLESYFLNDPTMADLVDGQFCVLGKVIRVVPAGQAGINLVRRGAFGKLQPEFLEQMMSGFRDGEMRNFFDLPPIELRVDGPAFHVIPLAIYA